MMIRIIIRNVDMQIGVLIIIGTNRIRRTLIFKVVVLENLFLVIANVFLGFTYPGIIVEKV